MNEIEKNRASALNSSRQAGSPGVEKEMEVAKNLSSPTSYLVLLTFTNILNDMPFFAAFGAAILKDILDLVVIGEIPGIGLMCTIFIGMMIYLAGAGMKSKSTKTFIKRSVSLIAAVIGEDIPGLAALPIETVTVFVNYAWTLAERKSAADEQKRGSLEIAEA